MANRVCGKHHEYCPDGVCKWCEPHPAPSDGWCKVPGGTFAAMVKGVDATSPPSFEVGLPRNTGWLGNVVFPGVEPFPKDKNGCQHDKRCMNSDACADCGMSGFEMILREGLK